MSEAVRKVKHVYFIRHGETAKNHGYRHQGPEEPLTARGKEQVREVAEFLRGKGIDTLISSNYFRARETAEMIAETLELPFLIEPSVREFGRPLPLYGRHHLSLASLRYFYDLYRNRLNLLWDKEGAENLAHVRERVRDARLMIENLPGERIAIVSHRIFMTMFTETVCYDKPLSFLKFLSGVLGRKRIPNTGTLHFICEPDPGREKKCTWLLEEVSFPPYNKPTSKPSAKS